MDVELNFDKSIYPKGILDRVLEIPDEIRNMTSDELEEIINPSLMYYRLKESFWEQAYDASFYKRTMMSGKIYKGICSKETFYKLIKNHYKLSWLLSPIQTYEDTTRLALAKVAKRYEELIAMPITSKRFIKNKVTDQWEEIEEVDPKKATALLAVIKNLEERIKGLAVQRQVIQNVNSHNTEDLPANPAEIDSRIKELENKLGLTEDNSSEGCEEETTSTSEGVEIDNC